MTNPSARKKIKAKKKAPSSPPVAGLRPAHVKRNAVDRSRDPEAVAQLAEANGFTKRFAKSLLKQVYDCDRDNRWIIESALGRFKTYFDIRDGVFSSDLQSATAFHDIKHARAIRTCLDIEGLKIVEVRLQRSGKIVVPAAKKKGRVKKGRHELD